MPTIPPSSYVESEVDDPFTIPSVGNRSSPSDPSVSNEVADAEDSDDTPEEPIHEPSAPNQRDDWVRHPRRFLAVPTSRSGIGAYPTLRT